MATGPQHGSLAETLKRPDVLGALLTGVIVLGVFAVVQLRSPDGPSSEKNSPRRISRDT